MRIMALCRHDVTWKRVCRQRYSMNNPLAMFCREELLEQTQVSRRYETRAKDLKTLLDSSNDKLQVSVRRIGLN